MKQFRILALAITVIFFAASCSKDKPNNPVDNASIQGRWNISSIQTVEPNNETNTYTGKQGDFIEFKADGTATSSVDGTEVSQNYKLVDAKHIEFDGDLTEIKELTSNKLVIYDAPEEGQPEKITYNFTK